MSKKKNEEIINDFEADIEQLRRNDLNELDDEITDVCRDLIRDYENGTNSTGKVIMRIIRDSGLLDECYEITFDNMNGKSDD